MKKKIAGLIWAVGLMLAGGGAVFGQQGLAVGHPAGMYWSECYDYPPAPANFWCPDCKTVRQDDGSYMVQDCPDATRTMMAAQLRALSKKNPLINPRPMADVPPPDDGSNQPAVDQNFFYVVGNGCPGGTNHPVNIAPVGWYVSNSNGLNAVTWQFWDGASPPIGGNGDRLDVVWHKQCTNHGASWPAFTAYGVHYYSTNDTWTTNSLQVYQTNNTLAFGRWFFTNTDTTNISLAICTNTPSLQGLPAYTNSCFGPGPESPYLGYLYPPLDDGGWGFTNNMPVAPYWMLYNSQGPPFYTSIFHPFSLPMRANSPPPPPVIDFPAPDFVFPARGGQNCTYSAQVSTNLIDWYTTSWTNTPMGNEGTNWMYCSISNIVNATGWTTNDPTFSRAFFRLHYESSP